MIIGTDQLKQKRKYDNISIRADKDRISESSSEKLLGVVIDNRLSWKCHLYGDENNEGLVGQLSKRIGMITKLSKFVNKERLKTLASGLFYSKITYCLPIFGNVLNLDTYKENNNRYTSFSKVDNNRLQILQNKLNRLLSNSPRFTPTVDLLTATKSISIQQMIAFRTLIMFHKIINTSKPSFIAYKLDNLKISCGTRSGRMYMLPNYKLSVRKESFL